MTDAARKTFVASFLGWTLDAYDFFLVIVVVPHLATDFKTSALNISFAVLLTLAMRPLGALIFGWFADKYGRRVPLMIDIALYSIIELATAFSPNLTVFLILRVIFGIAMGGEWGLGAALAMESLPPARRGLFSGILQEGYAVGNLLASLTLWFLFERIGWRGMFVLGAVPALLILYIRSFVPESPAWQANAHERIAVGGDLLIDSIKRYFGLFLYGALLMAAFNFISHGTQDPYPTFLTKQLGFSPAIVGQLNAISALGAICGGIVFGWLSQRAGRRIAMIAAAILGLAVIPLWAFSTAYAMLALGGFAMQFMVQGAWGVIPAHLNEIAPKLVRGTFPGFVYQFGNLIASPTLAIITWFATDWFETPDTSANYAHAMAVFTACALAGVVIFSLLGYAVTAEKRNEAL